MAQFVEATFTNSLRYAIASAMHVAFEAAHITGVLRGSLRVLFYVDGKDERECEEAMPLIQELCARSADLRLQALAPHLRVATSGVEAVESARRHAVEASMASDATRPEPTQPRGRPLEDGDLESTLTRDGEVNPTLAESLVRSNAQLAKAMEVVLKNSSNQQSRRPAKPIKKPPAEFDGKGDIVAWFANLRISYSKQ